MFIFLQNPPDYNIVCKPFIGLEAAASGQINGAEQKIQAYACLLLQCAEHSLLKEFILDRNKI